MTSCEKSEGQRWAKRSAQRRHCGQLKRQNDAKGGPRGYDAGQHVTGRKRHIMVDVMGLLLQVMVYPANVQDRDGALLVLCRLSADFPRLRLIWADGGYAGQLVDWLVTTLLCTLVIIKRSDDATGFQVLPRRWVVERTFAWLGGCRRLSKDYEALPPVSQAFI